MSDDDRRRRAAETVEAVRVRLRGALPRQAADVDVLKLGLAAAMRHRGPLLRTLYGRGVVRYLDCKACAKVCLRPEEMGALVGLDAPQSSALDVHLGANNPLHEGTVKSLEAALATTLCPERCAETWKRPITRCAAGLAARMETPKEVLEALLGVIPKADARRLGAVTEELEDAEDESDAHLLSTAIAVEALATALARAQQ